MDIIFCIEDDNDGRAILDYGVKVKLYKYSHVNHHDQNLIEWNLSYARRLKRSYKWTSTLQCVILSVSGGIPLTRVMQINIMIVG